jgi:RNA polymerase sigma-70 factor (ECF subfamily)
LSAGQTTAAVQQFLDQLVEVSGDASAEPLIRALIARSVQRLQLLCATFLHRSYPRLKKPPLNLQVDELLSSVVERLLKALNQARPKTVRQFFGLANQHMRWELNDLARRLDEGKRAAQLTGDAVPAPESTDSVLSPNAKRMLDAIEQLPDDEKEAFGLVRIQGMNQIEAAQLLGISAKTIQRRLNKSLVLLTESLADLQLPETNRDGE